MKKKLFAICLIAVLTLSALGVSTASTDIAASVQSLGIFSAAKWSEHYRAPNIAQVETYLDEHAIPLTSPETRTKAVQAFMSEWAKRNPTTPNPRKLEQLLERERTGATGLKGAQPQIMSLAVPVEFTNSDTFTWCGST